MNKKIYSINDIKGVDITSSPINVAPYRASHMLNMINDGGTNVKRHGWKGIATFEHNGERLPINGIYEYRDEYVVHAGAHFYRCTQNFELEKIKELTVTGAEIKSTKSKGYVRDGKLWIVGAGSYLVYDGATIQPVMNSEYSYIPTTSIGIKDAITSQNWEYQGESFQGVNLFNKRRINKLIGSDKTSSAYVLDGKIDTSQKVEINITTNKVTRFEGIILGTSRLKYDKTDTNLEQLLENIFDDGEFPVEHHYKNLYLELKYPMMMNSLDGLMMKMGDGPVTVTFHTNAEPIYVDLNSKITNYSGYIINKIITGITISDTANLSKLYFEGADAFVGDLSINHVIDGKSSHTTIKLGTRTAYSDDVPDDLSLLFLAISISLENRDNGIDLVKFGFSCPPMLEGDSNITIEYTAIYESDITISSSQEVALNAGTNVLCLVNNNNTVYFSDFLYGYGYFPDNDYIGIGKGNEPVTSIIALDRGIGIFKASELYLVNLNVSIVDKDFVVKIEPSVQGHYAGEGCENEFLGLNVNGDTLIYNSTGVHGVISSATKVTNMRSTNVNKALCAYTMEQRKGAHAVSHQGRYYLFIEDKVYIADTRYKYYEGNRLDSGFEYEWWIWDGCECRCAYSFKDKLYMGTKDGEIRVFGEGYRDIIETNVETDSQQLIYDGELFSIDASLYLEDGDKVKINNAYEKLNLDNISRKYNKYGNKNLCWLYFSQTDFLKLYPTVISEGAEITLYDETYGDLKCTVSSVDVIEFSAYVTFDGSKYNDLASYILVKEATEYQAVLKGENEFLLVNSQGETISFVNYGNISATLDKDRRVMCEFRTGVIDLANLHSKTLYRLSFTPTRETSGKISLGYTTNLSAVQKQRQLVNAFDFSDYDFNKFTFDGGFFKTYIKRVFERNFNYIMFEFASIDDGPFGIENAQAVYTINNELRSDR